MPDRALDALLNDQYRRWRRGRPIPVEEYFAEFPALLDDREAALGIVYNEFRMRKELGDQPRTEAFLRRFPQLSPDLEHMIELGEDLRPFIEILAEGPRSVQPASRDSVPGFDGLPPGTPVSASLRVGPSAKPQTLPSLLFGHEIVAELGSGGMGRVYKARDPRAGRSVALKVIKAGELASLSEVKRLHDEARTVAQLNHPNIVPIYEVGDEKRGEHYFSMKLIEGSSLAKRLTDYHSDPCSAARLMVRVARAVQEAHRHAILHRDLKPANILLDADGEPHVTDFGLAKRVGVDSDLTETGDFVGTVGYAVPEQASGQKKITTSADVYSLGAILYELLTGRPPFRSDSATETLKLVMEREPQRPGSLNPRIHRDLETICLKCLEKDPESVTLAQEVADDLQRWLDGEPIVARPLRRIERGIRWCRRNPEIAGLTAAVAASLVVGTVASLGFAFKAQDQSRQYLKAKTWAEQSEQAANESRNAAQKLSQQARVEQWRARRHAEFVEDLFKRSDPVALWGHTSDRSPGKPGPLTARDLLDRATAELRRESQDDPLVRAALMDTIGRSYCSLAAFKEAEPLLKAAKETRLRELGPDHPDVATSLHNLGWLAFEQGDLDGAEPLLRDALKIRLRHLDERSLEAAESMFLLAWLLNDRDEFDESEDLFFKVVEIRRKTPGSKRDLALAYLGLAGVQLEQGRSRRARDHILLATAALWGKGSDPLVVAVTLFMAGVSNLPQSPKDAEAMLDRCRAMTREKLGPDHPILGLILHCLGYACECQGHDKQANVYYNEALKLVRNSVGLSHPQAGMLVYSMALSLQRRGEGDKALSLCDELIDARRSRYGPESSLTADSKVLKAEFLGDAEVKQAERFYREAMAVYRKRERNRSRYRIVCLNKLGKILLNRGQVTEASRCFREAFALEYARKADDPSRLTEGLIQLDETLRKVDKDSAAEPYYRQAWDIINRYPAGLRFRSAVAQRYESLLRQTGVPGSEVDKRLGVNREPGVIEGEDLRVQGKPTGTVGPQDMRDWSNQWSGARQLWWRDQERDATLTIELPKNVPGTYDIVARFTKAPDYGIAVLSIDGHKLGTINLYNKEVTPSNPVALDVVTLRGGPHVLTVRMVDKDARSRGDYQFGFGLDWIKLTLIDPAF